MPEKRPVMEHEQIVYDGLFRYKDVNKLIFDWMSDKGYIPVEKRIHEAVTKSGKHIEQDLEPFKKINDYAKSVIRIHVTANNLKEVEVTVDGHKKKMQQGQLRVTFDSWLETDYAHKWETTPVFYVLRSLFEKYVYVPYMSGFIKGVRDDTMLLKDQLKAFLNVERLGNAA